MLNKELHLNSRFFSGEVEKKSTRSGYGDGLLEAAELNKDIVVLTGDLTESTRAPRIIWSLS